MCEQLFPQSSQSRSLGPPDTVGEQAEKQDCPSLKASLLPLMSYNLPLSQRELSARFASLILNEAWDQIVSHLYVSSSVAADLVVV